MSRLAPCLGCRRPIRDAACPFCGASRGEYQKGTAPVPRRFVAIQAALIAAGLVGGVSCTQAPPYGAPCPPGCYVPPADAAVDASDPFGDAALRDGGESDAGDAAPEGGADADAGLDASDGGG